MSDSVKMTGRLVAAARALVGVSAEEFGRAAGLTSQEMNSIEASGSARLRSQGDVEGMLRAFGKFGVIALGEDDGMGAGVRLKFTRQDVKQIARLEGEGGVVGSDDAP